MQACTNKKALVIVAHNDDWYGNAATAKFLTNLKWDVNAFYFSPTLNQIEHPDRELLGLESANKVKGLFDLCEFSRLDQTLRFDSIKTHLLNYPYHKFIDIYKTDSVKSVILDLIERFQPSVIFTLDDSIGLYGNSDHVFVSQTILKVCIEESIREDFPVERIYQVVMPPKQADGVMNNFLKVRSFLKPYRIFSLLQNKGFEESVYSNAKKICECKGMPLPTTQFKIDNLSKYKKEFIQSWSKHETKNFKRFVPFYNLYPHWIYYKILNYEYFRVIEIDKLPPT